MAIRQEDGREPPWDRRRGPGRMRKNSRLREKLDGKIDNPPPGNTENLAKPGKISKNGLYKNMEVLYLKKALDFSGGMVHNIF